MLYKPTLHIFILMVFYLVYPPKSFSATPEAKCPKTTDINDNMASKEVNLKTVLKQLSDLNQGTIDESVPFSALFTFDLNDSEAITRRISELKVSTGSAKIEIFEPYKTWQRCSRGNFNLQRINKLLDLEKKIDLERLQFLSKPLEIRTSVAKTFHELSKSNKDIEELNRLRSTSEEKQESARAGLANAESSATEAVSTTNRELAGYKAMVEKYLLDLEANQLLFLQYQEKQISDYSDFRKEITLLETEGREGSVEKILDNYRKSARNWRVLVSHVFELYLSNTEDVLPPAPLIQDLGIDKIPETSRKLLNELMALFEKAKNRRTEIQNTRSLFQKKEKEVISDLLLASGAVRAELIQSCRKQGCTDVFKINNDFLADIKKEVGVVPYKAISFGISKTVEIKRRFSEGVGGWVEISRQLIRLILILLSPLGLFLLFHRLAKGLDQFRRTMINRSMIGHKRRTTIAIWIGRVTPFLPWVLMYFSTSLSKILLLGTDLKELSEVLRYLNLYFLYRIVRIALSTVMQSTFTRGSLERFKAIEFKIHSSATRLTRIGLFELILFGLTEDVVRKALVYTILLNIVPWINIILLFFEASRFENEIFEAAKEIMSDRVLSFFERIRKNYFLRKLSNPFIFIYILIRLAISYIADRAKGLDLVKWVSAEIFKKRLESKIDKIETSDGRIPEDYLKYFKFREAADDQVYVEVSQRLSHIIATQVTDWVEDKFSDDVLLVRGNRGMGKTSAMIKAKALITNSRSIYFALTQKYTTKEEAYELLSKLSGNVINSSEDFMQFDSKLDEKLTFLIDDYQNIFLAQVGGFEAYKCFQEILALPTKNIFWCLSINSRSWSYVNGVFGKDHFYGKVMDVIPWKDTEIQELILNRHRLTGHTLEFDNLISALGSEPNSQLSNTQLQFFRLLWGQSRGNPRSALVYWLSALSTNRAGILQVGIPTFLNSAVISSLSDDTLFVLSAITRHENLNFSQICSITGNKNASIRQSLKQCINEKIIWTDSSEQFRVTPMGQYLTDYYLLGKNFIFE